MHTVLALLCFVVVIHWLIFPYPSGLLHWHCGNLTIAPVPAKQPWWIWINTSCEFIMNDCITTTKQSTTKPCAYFLGYIVVVPRRLPRPCFDTRFSYSCMGISIIYGEMVVRPSYLYIGNPILVRQRFCIETFLCALDGYWTGLLSFILLAILIKMASREICLQSAVSICCQLYGCQASNQSQMCWWISCRELIWSIIFTVYKKSNMPRNK